MKKLIALLLALMMVMALAACGDDTKPSTIPEADGSVDVSEDADVAEDADAGEAEEAETDPEEEVEEDTEEEDPAAEVTAPFDTALAIDAVGFMYAPDYASVLLMGHPAILEGIGEDGLVFAVEECNAQMQEFLDAVAAEMGETSLVIEAGEVEACGEDELAAYAVMFEENGLIVNAAVKVPVIVTDSTTGTVVSEHALYFVEIDGVWYLDIYSIM